MDNDKVSQLVDHKVFQQLQTAPTDHPTGQGTIIFANSFTGTPVEMNEEVRHALTSESIFIGNNPLVQLQKALERVDKGPWYIDCRGDVLYIHNKPYSIPPVHNYVYAQENGEVLSMSFKTNYRTRSVGVGATSSFDNYKKNIKTTSTGLSVGSEQEIHDKAIAMDRDQLRVSDNPNYLSPNISSESNYWETHYRFPNRSPEYIQAESDENFKRVTKEDYEYMKTNVPEVHTNYVQSLLNSKGMGRGSKGEKEFQQRLKAVEKDPRKVQALFQEYFGQDKVYINSGVYRPIIEQKSLSELIGGGGSSPVYIPAYDSNGRAKGASYVYQWGSASPIRGGDFAYSVEQYLKQFYKGKNFAVVSKPTYTRGAVASGSRYGNVVVQFAHKVLSKYPISGVNLISDYYSRYLESPGMAFMRYLINNAMGNRTRKITEKVLEVEMVVVGRPTLTASAKVHIENIGSRSGDYHITRVIHKLSSDGYTCSLTLTPGSYKTASSTNTLEAGVGSSKRTRRVGGKEVQPTNGRVNLDLSEASAADLEVFNSYEGNVKKQTEVATMIAYNKYKHANDKPGTYREGAYTKSVVINGDKTSTKYTRTQQKDKGYEDFKKAYGNEIYERVRKRADYYRRYGR